MPKTHYRFRVAPLKTGKDGKEHLGEWSEAEGISTTELQGVDPQSLGQHAAIAPLQKQQA